jgi:hypothetical protein
VAKKRRKPHFFLETSVEVQRRFGHSLVKRDIDATLGDSLCASSFYVLMEYKRVVVKTLITFWALLKEEATVADALTAAAAGFSAREPKLVLMALAELLTEGDLQNDKDKITRQVEMLIEASLLAFDRDVTEMIPHRQSCPLSRASIEESYSRFMREIECETKCTVDAFWASSKAQLDRLTAQGEAHKANRGFAAVLPNMKEAAEDSTSQKTKRKCMQCGDVIIALEMPSDLTLLTFDKSFEAFCAILRKQCQRIPPFQELRARRGRPAIPQSPA